MTTLDPDRPWRGFSAPLGPSGAHALYGPPPWEFEGTCVNVSLRVGAAMLAPLVPEPLQVAPDPVVRISVFDFVCDCGLGQGFVQHRPDLAQQAEAVIGIGVVYAGKPGYWPSLLWCTSDAEMAVGREMYGWPQRLGSVSLTRRPLRGWEAGDRATGLVSRGDRAVLSVAVTLERTGQGTMTGDSGSLDSHIGRMPIFTQTTLADPMRPGLIERRLVGIDIANVRVEEVWRGSAAVELVAPETAFLRDATVIEGRWLKMRWTKPYAQNLIAESSAPA